MTAITCSSAGVKDLADGSLRITFEFEPRHAKEAFLLFGTRGTACAIIALTQEASKAAAQSETIAADKPKGGPLAKLAGMFCSQPEFWDFINLSDYPDKKLFAQINDSVDAAAWVRRVCGIESRAELDNNSAAAERFHELIRKPYKKYLETTSS